MNQLLNELGKKLKIIDKINEFIASTDFEPCCKIANETKNKLINEIIEIDNTLLNNYRDLHWLNFCKVEITQKRM